MVLIYAMIRPSLVFAPKMTIKRKQHHVLPIGTIELEEAGRLQKRQFLQRNGRLVAISRNIRH
jgi:hypothetical protein